MGNKLANMITGSRLILAPIIFFSIISGKVSISILLYLCALLTDVLDGFVARVSGSVSKNGAFYDACADFVLVFSGFWGLVITRLLPLWVFLLALFMFGKFVSGFENRNGVYDVYGKRFGILSLLVTPLCLLSPALLGYVFRPLVVLAFLSTITWMDIHPLMLVQKASRFILDQPLINRNHQNRG